MWSHLPSVVPISLTQNFVSSCSNLWNHPRPSANLYGKKYVIPRDEVRMTEDKCLEPYFYSGHNVPTISMTSQVLNIKEWLQQYLVEDPTMEPPNFNEAFVLRYRGGNDSISWHTDNKPHIDQRYPIVSLSFGASRNFQIRRKKKKNETTMDKTKTPITTICLSHRDVMVMYPGMQDSYEHQIPKQKKGLGVSNDTDRICIVFRVIKQIK